MGENCNLYVGQNCPYQCCDYLGYCPDFPEACFYFYKSKSALSGDAVAGIIVGVIIAIIIVGAILIWKRKCCWKPEHSQKAGTINESNAMIPTEGNLEPIVE
jgi:hypothetical protein